MDKPWPHPFRTRFLSVAAKTSCAHVITQKCIYIYIYIHIYIHTHTHYHYGIGSEKIILAMAFGDIGPVYMDPLG